MKVNIGSLDRLIRMVAGSALIAWAFFFNGPIWAYIGVLAVLTAVLKWCPAYTIFGLTTCKSRTDE